MSPNTSCATPCAICGQSRYDHDMVRIPKFRLKRTRKEWAEILGVDMAERIMPNGKLTAYACVEHFDPHTALNSDGGLFNISIPLSIPKEEKRFIDNFLHDHWCFKLYPNPKSTPGPLRIVSCSLCSREVARKEMPSHAEIHILMNVFDAEYLCEAHTQNQNSLENEILECENCSIIRSNAHINSWKLAAERCFPMFEFEIVGYAREIVTTYTLEAHIRMEYALTRNTIFDELDIIPEAFSTDISDRSIVPKIESCSSSIDDQCESTSPGCSGTSSFNFEDSMGSQEINLFRCASSEHLEPVDFGDMLERSEFQEPLELTMHDVKQEDIDMFDAIESKVKLEPMDDCEMENDADNNNSVAQYPINSSLTYSPEEVKPNLSENIATAVGTSPGKWTLEPIYQQNRHPPLARMVELIKSTKLGCTLRTLFEFMDVRRKTDNEECRGGDECAIVRKFLADERLPEKAVIINSLMKKRMEHEFEEHLQSGEPFNQGVSFLLAMKLGLPPKLLKKKYVYYLQTIRRRQPQQTKREKESSKKQYGRKLTATERYVLEEEYLKKTRVDPAGEWRWTELTKVAYRTHMTPEQVSTWMSRRKMKATTVRHVYTAKEREIIVSSFKKNQYPNASEYRRLANCLNLSLAQVHSGFTDIRNNRRVQELKNFTTKQPIW